MSTTIKASEIQQGHSLPGLDNGYVIDVQENDGYLGVPTGRHNVALSDDFICLTMNDSQGAEFYLLVPGDLEIEVDQEEPRWVG